MRRTPSLFTDFKAFINRGNVVDLAVAVVVGGAFGKVVDAVVSLLMGSLLQPALKAANVDAIANWPAGAVLVAVINFLVISFVVFLIVRSIETLHRKEQAAPAPDTQAQLASAVTRWRMPWTDVSSKRRTVAGSTGVDVLRPWAA